MMVSENVINLIMNNLTTYDNHSCTLFVYRDALIDSDTFDIISKEDEKYFRIIDKITDGRITIFKFMFHEDYNDIVSDILGLKRL